VVRSEPSSAESERFESMEAVFLAFESQLLGYARRLLNNGAMAEDVVQDAFIRLHAHFREVRTPRQWLYRTVHNLALNQRRKSDRNLPLTAGPSGSEETESIDVPDPAPLPDERIAREEGIGQVRLGLKTLDERSRTLLELRFRENLGYREISERTGLTVGHVGYLLHHAIKALGVELSKAGVIR